MARLNFLVLVFAVLLTACGGSYQTSKTGLKYKFHIQNQGVKKPEIGEVMYLHYTIQNSDGEQLFSTYTNRNGNPDVLHLEKPYYPGDYFEALSMMSVGDSATFLINADSFYLKNLRRTVPEGVKKGSKLMFNVRLNDVMSATASEEQKNKEKLARYYREYEMMEAYVKQKELAIETTPEGIKYLIVSNGNPKIDSGDVVTFQYKGKLLDDSEFINTYAAKEPQTFTVGAPNPIAFYSMVLPLLAEKEKGTFIIPYVHAFGEMGVSDKVPPYSTVVYDIEILKVKKYKNEKKND